MRLFSPTGDAHAAIRRGHLSSWPPDGGSFLPALVSWREPCPAAAWHPVPRAGDARSCGLVIYVKARGNFPIKLILMTQNRLQLPALIAALFLVGACSGGARDVDYSRSRAISADTAATHEEGSTSRSHAITTRSEPVGSIPWQMGR